MFICVYKVLLLLCNSPHLLYPTIPTVNQVITTNSVVCEFVFVWYESETRLAKLWIKELLN